MDQCDGAGTGVFARYVPVGEVGESERDGGEEVAQGYGGEGKKAEVVVCVYVLGVCGCGGAGGVGEGVAVFEEVEVGFARRHCGGLTL